jgi:hypothetical protein
MCSEAKGAGSELQESRRRTSTLASLTALLALALGGHQSHAVEAGGSPVPMAQDPASPSASATEADDEDEAPPPPSFPRDVMPTLGRYCEPCHGARQQHGGLRLDGYDSLMRGGEHGPVIVPGNPQRSLLVAKIERRHKPSMPPRKKLPAPLVTKIRAWIAAGAVF